VPLCRQAAPDGPEPELPGPQHHQPLPGCPLRYRLVNAQAPAARQQAAPAAVAVAVTAVSYGGHISFLPSLNAPAELLGQRGDNACGVEDRTAPSFRAQLSRPGTGSSGHKITARSAASWMTELSSSARASATSYSSQDTTKVTGPAGGSG
jgi:hypothetical protein